MVGCCARRQFTPLTRLRTLRPLSCGVSQASHLSKRLTRSLRTTDGGTLRTVLDARSYMLRLSKDRQRSAQWQRAAQLTKADVGAFSRQVELALRYDGKLDVTQMPPE
jgi:hypothetical protein